jgi:hypothetical protein
MTGLLSLPTELLQDIGVEVGSLEKVQFHPLEKSPTFKGHSYSDPF